MFFCWDLTRDHGCNVGVKDWPFVDFSGVVRARILTLHVVHGKPQPREVPVNASSNGFFSQALLEQRLAKTSCTHLQSFNVLHI